MLEQPWGGSVAGRFGALVYGAVAAGRNALYGCGALPVKPNPLPLISIGGIHAGGTGKTPLVGLVAQHLTQQGHTVIVASRGYRRVRSTPVVVAPGEDAPWELVGDEPAMLRRRLPSLWLAIGADRARVLRTAVKRIGGGSNSVAVLDDGFQHRRIRRDIDIVCLPPNPWHDRLLPAGLRREPFSSIRRAHVVCMTGSERVAGQLARDAQCVRERYATVDVFVMLTRPGTWVNAETGEEAARPDTRKPVLICGIARPERFADLVAAQGITPVRTAYYPDHHRYTAREIEAVAGTEIDGILTTEKDAVRLVSQNLAIARRIWYLTLRQDFAEAGERDRFLKVIQRRTLCREAIS